LPPLLASFDELEGFYTHLAQALEHMGYFKDKRPKALLMRRLRRFFGRAEPEKGRSHIQRKIIRVSGDGHQDLAQI
jgi:tRNA C32,U32 (ribose-2'-O)-methylase TrmJ